jgi:hypothetical protein
MAFFILVDVNELRVPVFVSMRSLRANDKTNLLTLHVGTGEWYPVHDEVTFRSSYGTNVLAESGRHRVERYSLAQKIHPDVIFGFG